MPKCQNPPLLPIRKIAEYVPIHSFQSRSRFLPDMICITINFKFSNIPNNIADIISCWSGTGTTTYGGVDEIARSQQRKDSPEKLSVSSQDLKDKLEDVIEKLRNRVPHSDILDYLKAKDGNPLW